jgi:hypothetical protein
MRRASDTEDTKDGDITVGSSNISRGCSQAITKGHEFSQRQISSLQNGLASLHLGRSMATSWTRLGTVHR